MKIKRYLRIASVPALALCLTAQAQAAGSGMTGDNMLQELKKMVEKQQAQIDRQAAELSELRQLLTGSTGTAAKTAQADMADKEEIKVTDKMVTSGLSNVNLGLYGQINKAFLFGDNGNDNQWYIVDNINSQTRLGLKAAVDTGIGWFVDGRIEYGIVSNGSSDVKPSNSNNATSNNFNLRWAEVSFKNNNFGEISLGKGSSASDNTAEMDLSGTTVSTYASVADMTGSTNWYDNSTATVSDTQIKNVFSDFDGLGRTDRLRYDTPSFGSFSLAGSASSGDAFDGALLFYQKYGETIIGATFGLANPGDLIEDTDMQYSGSVSVLFPMGFNSTFSAGSRDLKDDTREDPTNWWAKLGYRINFYDAATTAFSVDYGETSDLWADGDTAKSWALAAVHNVKDWGTELYMAYRVYQLDSESGDFDDIYAFWTGARVKF